MNINNNPESSRSGRCSILWYEGRPLLSPAEKKTAHRLIEDLQLDRAFRIICPDTMYREAFLSVLLSPLTDTEEIAARQNVLREFEKTPALLEKLTETVRRLNTIKNGWDSERSRIFAARRANPADKSLFLYNSRENLVLTAHFIRTGLNAIRELYDVLNMFGITSGLLGRLKDECLNVSMGSGAEYILSLCEKAEKGLPHAHTYEVEIDFDGEYEISTPFLHDFDFTPINVKPQRKANPLAALFSKNSKNADSASNQSDKVPEPVYRATVNGFDADSSFDLSARAINETDKYLTLFLRAVFDRFSPLEEELYFCSAVLMHINRLKERHVETVYAQMLSEEENLTDIENLSDLLLLTESMSALSVVPNDVHFGVAGDGGTDSGILVTGRNNSGKTVYLRSVGTAVLLSQCGIPIPCKSALISVRPRIFTSFAGAEGELIPSSSAGRFEEEAALLSEIIDGIVPHSLVLLNETFQTTAYDEGADGMYGILGYLSSIGCGFIFVTHLTKLCSLYKDTEGVKIMRTSDDPRTKYKVNII